MVDEGLKRLLPFQDSNDKNNNNTVDSAFEDHNFLSKKGHPKELFLSSNGNAVVDHTKKVLVILDGEVVHIKVHVIFLFPFWHL